MALLECLLLAIMGSGGIAGTETTQPRLLTADAIDQPNGGVSLTGFPGARNGGASVSNAAKHKRRKHKKGYFTPKKEGSLH